jgi:hypothetical protein
MLYEAYIRRGAAPYELNLSRADLDDLEHNLAQFEKLKHQERATIFAKVQGEVFHLMRYNILPPFLVHQPFVDYARTKPSTSQQGHHTKPGQLSSAEATTNNSVASRHNSEVPSWKRNSKGHNDEAVLLPGAVFDHRNNNSSNDTEIPAAQKRGSGKPEDDLKIVTVHSPDASPIAISVKSPHTRNANGPVFLCKIAAVPRNSPTTPAQNN